MPRPSASSAPALVSSELPSPRARHERGLPARIRRSIPSASTCEGRAASGGRGSSQHVGLKPPWHGEPAGLSCLRRAAEWHPGGAGCVATGSGSAGLAGNWRHVHTRCPATARNGDRPGPRSGGLGEGEAGRLRRVARFPARRPRSQHGAASGREGGAPVLRACGRARPRSGPDPVQQRASGRREGRARVPRSRTLTGYCRGEQGIVDKELVEIGALVHDVDDYKYSGSETAGMENVARFLAEKVRANTAASGSAPWLTHRGVPARRSTPRKGQTKLYASWREYPSARRSGCVWEGGEALRAHSPAQPSPCAPPVQGGGVALFPELAVVQDADRLVRTRRGRRSRRSPSRAHARTGRHRCNWHRALHCIRWRARQATLQ